MLYFLPFFLLTVGMWWWLLRPRPATDHREPQDIPALLQYYAQQSALSAEERDYRLYHELRQLRQSQHTQQSALPWWVYGIVLVNSAVGFALWYGLSGAQQQQWRALNIALEQPLKRAQFLNEPLELRGINPLVLCQALQERIDRTQRQQLHTLGQCYFQHQAYDHALSIYQQLTRRYPEQSTYRLLAIQAELFRDPERPLSTALEHNMKAYIADYSDDTFAPVLLAAAYERADRGAEAKALWQQLAQTLPAEHPLFAQVQSRAFTFTLNADIHVSPERQSALPAKARLFLVLRRSGANAPPLAVKILPVHNQQSATLSSEDLMISQAFDPNADYELTAFVSEDGSAQGKRHSAQVYTLKLSDSSLKKLEIE